MIDEVKCLESICTETVAREEHDADPACPPVGCSADDQAGEMAPSEQIHLYLLAIGERLRQHIAEVGHRYDLTPQQALVMDRLVERHSMGQLAEELACDPSNVTGLIRRLEQRGLVAREPDEADRRTKWLFLTPEGKELRDAFRRDIFQGRNILAGLGDEDQGQLLGALRGVLANLETRQPQA